MNVAIQLPMEGTKLSKNASMPKTVGSGAPQQAQHQPHQNAGAKGDHGFHKNVALHLLLGLVLHRSPWASDELRLGDGGSRGTHEQDEDQEHQHEERLGQEVSHTLGSANGDGVHKQVFELFLDRCGGDVHTRTASPSDELIHQLVKP